jgi:hypothetical protein
MNHEQRWPPYDRRVPAHADALAGSTVAADTVLHVVSPGQPSTPIGGSAALTGSTSGEKGGRRILLPPPVGKKGAPAALCDVNCADPRWRLSTAGRERRSATQRVGFVKPDQTTGLVLPESDPVVLSIPDYPGWSSLDSAGMEQWEVPEDPAVAD